MCARSCALRSMYRVRRTMTSIWWAVQYRIIWSSRSVRGTPSTRATMLAPKVSCSSVCLYRLFSTTLATASRLSTMTSRRPTRALLSSLHVGDAGDPAVVGQFGDLLRQVVGVYLERQLGGDQAGPALAVFLHLDDRAHGDRATAGAVGLLDSAAPDDLRGRREIRPLDPLDQRFQQFLVGRLEVLQVPLHALVDLAQVVRRDLGGHRHRDALRPIDEQVREPGRQHHGLSRAAVVVRPEIDSLLVDVPQHLHRQRSQPALGVAHGRGRVVARRTEVALAVDQRHPHRPVLGQPDESVVDR